MSKKTTFTAGNIDAGVLSDVCVSGSPDTILDVIDALRVPAGQVCDNWGMTDEQFATVVGANTMVEIKFFGDEAHAEDFNDYVMDYPGPDNDVDREDEGMTGEELEQRLTALISMAKGAPRVNSKVHLRARLAEVQAGLEQLLRDFNA